MTDRAPRMAPVPSQGAVEVLQSRQVTVRRGPRHEDAELMVGQQHGSGRRLLDGLGQLSAGRGAERGRVRRT